MFYFLKRALILTSILSSAIVFATNEQSIKKPHYDQGYEINKQNLMQAYSAPARVNVEGNLDLFIEGSFIWWQPKEKGLAIGASSFLNMANNPVNIFNFKANYKTGFKTGIGFHNNLDDWTIFAQYTWFNRDSHNTVEREDAFFSDWLYSTTTQAEAKWDVDINFFELELSRANVNGKRVIFAPHVGIMGGWIDQKYLISSIADEAKAFSDSWLIGPKAGVKTSWKIKSDIKLIGNVSASVFYQDYTKVSYELKNIITDLFIERINMRTHNLTPNLNMAAGLAYGLYLYDNLWHFDFLVKYEFIHFWNQNQMRYLLNQLGFIRFDAGSLMLHGITASFRWDF